MDDWWGKATKTQKLCTLVDLMWIGVPIVGAVVFFVVRALYLAWR